MIYVVVLMLVAVLTCIKIILDELTNLEARVHELKKDIRRMDHEVTNYLKEIKSILKEQNIKLKELDELGREILFTHPVNKKTVTNKKNK